MVEKKKQKAKRGQTKEAQQRNPGAAGDVMKVLDTFIPGMGKMIEGLQQSEAFQERLEAVNKEVDSRLRKGTSGQSLIPKVEGGLSIRSLAEEKPAFEVKEDRPRATRRKAAHPRPAIDKEVPVDIFEDATHLKIIAELPGVQQKDVKVALHEETLVISAETPYHKYYREVTLPCPVKGEPRTSCKNGVLEIELEKED